MYIVRFIRKDSKPIEEYLYHYYADAKYHFEPFVNDVSDMYDQILLGKIVTESQFELDLDNLYSKNEQGPFV